MDNGRIDLSARPHLLAMNDSRELLDLLDELLTEEGYRVSTSLIVHNLQTVIDLAPDGIVLDVLFDGAERGWEFLTLVRLDPRTRAIPVVLCTAATRTVTPMVERLTRMGVQIVPKPFDLEELLTAIRAVVPTGVAITSV